MGNMGNSKLLSLTLISRKIMKQVIKECISKHLTDARWSGTADMNLSKASHDDQSDFLVQQGDRLSG